MDVTIIGAGNIARGIATRALAGGHRVTLLGPEAEELAGDLSGNVDAGAVGDALTGEIVVLAVPYPAVSELVDRYSGELDGRVVVDITNTVDFSTFEPIAIDAGSAAQEIADAVHGAEW